MFSLDVLKDDKAPAFVLAVVVLRKYGFEALEWEPEFLRAEIERDYSIKLSNLQSDKIQAMINVMTSDHFEHDWRVFEVVCHLFNNQAIDHDDLCPLEAEEIAVGVAEATLIKKDVLEDDETLTFGEEVRAYVGLICYEYGMHKAPKIFPTAIMPKSNKADDKEKNEALKEIFDAHISYILDYAERLQ